MAESRKSAVDTSRAPRGERAARMLVDAVLAGDDRLERHYLEIKSSLDLRAKRDQAKLAKFILGAANRMPDKAADAFEGNAVMVIGAEAPTPRGVPPVEALEIEKAVMPFLGADGPRWDISRVSISGSSNEVLLLLVDSPAWGHGPFICRKSGDGVRDGAVYVRADGETREANSGELAQLLYRGTRSTFSEVDFDVQVVGSVRPFELDEELTLEQYIQRERARLASALERTKGPPRKGASDGSSGGGATSQIAAMAAQANSAFSTIQNAFTTPETRSEEEYLTEVDAWEAEFRSAWPAATLVLIAGLATPVELRVENRTKTFLHDVELKAHIAGAVHGLESWKSGDEMTLADVDLPGPPRAWGPRPTLSTDAILGTYCYPTIAGPSMPNLSRTRWTNTGSVDWTFSIGQLRGREVDTSDDEDLVLFTSDNSLPAAQGTWSVTAGGYNEIFEGEFQVTVGEPLDLTATFRHLMRLE